MTKMKRRTVLGAFATGGGALILQSLATGIPAQVLLNPLAARAAPTDALPPKLLVLSCSDRGDAVNANIPGTYEQSAGSGGPFHPADAAMAATNLTLSGTSYTAAKPWADLSQSVLDRTVFFHHATYTPVHGEMGRVQRMMDETEKNDMLVSIIARELAAKLGTVQADPVSLGAGGGELLSSEGRVLGNVAPSSVKRALGKVDGPLGALTALRDQHIDQIYALYKERGTPSQRTLLDSWARSRDEVRSLSTTLLQNLDAIDGDDQHNEVLAAATLAAMGITPVITVHLAFSGDNHSDNDLVQETEEHLQSLADLQFLMDTLDSFRSSGVLKHDVLFASLNVFGRTMRKKGLSGRDHNAGHHCLVLMGNGIKGGVVGGIEKNEKDEFIARSIDAATGQAGGDIPFEETLGAAGKTLGVAMGVDPARMDQILPPGKVVQSVFA